MKYRTRAVAAAALTIAATLTAPGTAAADSPSADGPTITVTIRNETDAPMVLTSKDNPYGSWVDEPATVVPARSSETVSASSSDRRGFGVQVDYTMPGDATVTLMANNYGTGVANGDGTHIDGANRHGYAVEARVDAGYPFMAADFAVAPR
ncbi:hypothetical protein [Rhodococcus sp. (in: high G+C Gram-positive bacteria)]|uniref:hypothetical protein n=1 Tax=Rhodococcus sp. TaxID=1831 RepID=UPI001A0D02F6|nr:hypothetical protein [Rhodococcus sp. (in: high G+C Gram-positive bacteria)]MBF0662042.1 hypothetical protein [Rhodococcus sp. (in: high G+C Gram-positive bacteria)]